MNRKTWRAGLCLAFIFGGVASAWAQPNPSTKPVQISDFPLATVESLGREMYFHDQLAWKATDALTKGKHDTSGLRGWVVIRQQPGYRVRFIHEAPAGYEAAYDVVFDEQMRPTVRRPDNTALSDFERRQFEATLTARRDVPTYCVDEHYNTIVLRHPDGGGWVVWLLEPMTKANTYPIAGHWRYLISDDGKSISRRDRLGNSCLSAQKKADVKALLVGNVVSQAPLETHVFTNYAAKLDIYVSTGKDGLWLVHEGKIIAIDPETVQGAEQPESK